MKTKRKPFYGWSITAMGTLANALQGGFIFWTMGMYTSAFEDHFNAPRARVTLIETFLMVSSNLMSPLVGIFVDKRSARHLVVIGALALGAGLILISFAGTLLNIWIVFASLIPIAAMALGVMPSSAMISRWFRRRRGLALGISLTGSSIGGALTPPLLTYMFMAHGWRTTLFWCGVFVILLAPVFYRILVNHPEDIGLQAEEESPGDTATLSEADSVDWTIRELLRTSAFWIQVVITGCLLAVTLGTLANLSLHAKDLGFVGQQTAMLYSVIAFFSFNGKIFFGFLIDRVGIRPAGFMTVVLMASGMLVLLMFKSYPALLTASLLIGSATGGVTPIWTNMIARGFGAMSFGRAFGMQSPMSLPITAPSAPLAGYISDTTGTYDLVFAIYIGLTMVAATGLFFLKRPVHPKRPQVMQQDA